MSIEFTPTNTSSRLGPLRRNTHTYDLIRQCIHCGFCLPTCPTYAVLGVEMDSPRGRIYQMQAVADKRLEITDDFVEHIYCCVGCRACETACPSGVQFGKLLEAAREQIQLEQTSVIPTYPTAQHPTTQGTRRNPLIIQLLRRFFFNILLPSRIALSFIFGGLKFYQRSGLRKLVHSSGLLETINNWPTLFQGKLKLPEELLDSAKGDIISERLPEITPAIGQRLYRVGFVSGCIMDQIFHNINEATIRVLSANGCEVITPPKQSCCGALHVHAGESEGGRMLARHNIDIFEPYNCDAIIINSAGCGSTLKEYDHLLRDDQAYVHSAQEFSKKVKDISEFLANIELNSSMGEIKHTVAYHDACHLIHGQKIKQQPRQLIKSIPGITLIDLKESDWCCGSAGIYNITNQEMAQALLERKMNNIVAAGADIIATGNPGCLMQIAMGARERGLSLDIKHPVELLDESYRAGGAYNMLTYSEVKQRRWRTLFLGLGISIIIGAILLRPKRAK